MNQPAAAQLDLVLPCFNPAQGWVQRVLQSWNRLREALPDLPIRLILVNDGSTRGLDTSDIDQLKQAIPDLMYVASSPNMGKGYALRKGVSATSAPWVIYTDIDFPYEEQSLIGVLKKLQSGEADVVVGVREDDYYEGIPADRRRISRLLRWMLKTTLKLKVTDTQCGLKGFNQRGKEVFLRTTINRFLFDLEFIFLASNEKNMRLIASSARLKPGIVFSHVSVRVLIREGWNFLRVLLRAFGRWLGGGK